MDRVSQYRSIVRRIIEELAAFGPADGDISVETIFDDDQGHYELLYSGWDGYRRVHRSVIHVDIRDGKIWVQEDGTEDGITPELLAAGVPHEHIVLAFHHPDERKHTPFAVA